ncbi:MAG: acyl carrier protein [Magnetococcales bacterium]|nr:acyl carrier protein [Magnetococcales bacterium]
MSDLLVQLFAEILELPEEDFSDDTAPENTPKWDSLASMSLVSGMEDRFDVEFSTMEIMKMRNLGITRKILTQKGVSFEAE